MAVTKIWVIKDSLQRVLDYAANPDKTEYDALAQTLHYAENDAKTKLNDISMIFLLPINSRFKVPSAFSKSAQMSSDVNASSRSFRRLLFFPRLSREVVIA